jgi:hypothetical protein
MVAVVAGLAAAQTTGPAESDNPYVVDFTKTLGKYSIASAEGKHVPGEGVVLTDLKTTDGPMLEGEIADISQTPIAVVEVENRGNKTLLLYFKVKSPVLRVRLLRVGVEPGKSTLRVDLRRAEIDLTRLNYVKLFGEGKADLVVKSISFAKAE